MKGMIEMNETLTQPPIVKDQKPDNINKGLEIEK